MLLVVSAALFILHLYDMFSEKGWLISPPPHNISKLLHYRFKIKTCFWLFFFLKALFLITPSGTAFFTSTKQ